MRDPISIQSDRTPRLRRWVAAAAILVAMIASLPWLRDALPLAWEFKARALIGGIRIDHDVRIAMPDGVELAASLYLPRFSPKPGPHPLPTVFIRLPYNRFEYESALRSALWFARNGYAVLVQDVRGTFESQGKFGPWEHGTSDGVATLDWITRQPWSNGKVGTFGCSALGELQYSLARAGHPAHAAMIAIGAGGAWGSPRPNLDYGDGFYEGGVLQLASTFGWMLMHGARDPHSSKTAGVDIPAALRTLPIQDMVSRLQPAPNNVSDFVRLAPDDAGWARFDLVGDADTIAVPALVISTWGDQTIAGTLALAEKRRATSSAQGAQTANMWSLRRAIIATISVPWRRESSESWRLRTPGGRTATGSCIGSTASCAASVMGWPTCRRTSST